MNRSLVPIAAGLASIVLLFALMEHVLLVRVPAASVSRPLRRVSVSSGVVCPSDIRLPSWIHKSSVLKVAMAEEGSPYSGWEYVGPDSRVEFAWVQDDWNIDVGGLTGTPVPSVVRAALLNHQLPGVGVLAWQYRNNNWATVATWKYRGTCYQVHANVTPDEAPAVVSVLVAWRKDKATLYSCRTTGDRVVCMAVRSAQTPPRQNK